MSEKTDSVNVHYQFSFLIKLCLILIISSVLSIFIFYNFISHDLGGSYTNARFVLQSVNDFLFPSLWFSITIFTLTLSLGCIVISILVSHKFAGPIYRLENTLSDFNDGNFYTITLRPKDQVQPLANSFNKLTASLSNNFTSAKEHAGKLRTVLEEERNEYQKADPDFQRITRLNEELMREAGSLKEIFSGYKTDK